MMAGMIRCGKIDGLNMHCDVTYLHVKRIPLGGYINIIVEDVWNFLQL
jgi:hypothetical protein